MFTAAQTLYLEILSGPVEVSSYKAPHAPQGTPARPKYPRQQQMIFSKADDGMVPRRRLFKGHRS